MLEAADLLADDLPGLGVLVVTSADRLHADWRAAQAGEGGAASALERLLAPLAADAPLITVLDGHPATLAWLGSATGRRVYPLGVDRFGQSGDIPDLYREYELDAAAIIDRAARACRDRAAACRSPMIAAAGRGPLDPVGGRLRPRRQQRGDPAAAAAGLRRLPGQHRAARASSGPWRAGAATRWRPQQIARS